MTSAVPATIQVDETSYRMPGDATFEQWMEHGRTLLGIMRAVTWWVGDWIIAGEGRFGEVYAQAVDLTGLSESTLRQAAWVASRIPPDERRATLSFAHHRAVAALEPAERDALLTIAEEQSLSERELRRLIRERRDTTMVRGDDLDPVDDALRTCRALLTQARMLGDWSLVDDAIGVIDRAVHPLSSVG